MKNCCLLPIKISTFPNREIRVPDIVMKNFDVLKITLLSSSDTKVSVPKITQKPFLLSPDHMDKMKKLPF